MQGGLRKGPDFFLKKQWRGMLFYVGEIAAKFRVVVIPSLQVLIAWLFDDDPIGKITARKRLGVGKRRAREPIPKWQTGWCLGYAERWILGYGVYRWGLGQRFCLFC